MRYNEELVQQLRKGGVVLKNGFNKQTDDLVNYCFPKDGEKPSKWEEAKLITDQRVTGFWYYRRITNLPIKEASDFIINEELDFNEPFSVEFNGVDQNYPVPTTKSEAEELIKKLQAFEFPKPTKLTEITIQEFTEDEITLIKLIRMRDVWRDGWVCNTNDSNYFYSVCIYKEKFRVIGACSNADLFSFETEDTANKFLETFEKELNQIKHLITWKQ